MPAISSVATLIGVTMITVRTVSAWLDGQILIVLRSNILPRMPLLLWPWNIGTNPDIAFVRVSPNSRLPDGRVL